MKSFFLTLSLLVFITSAFSQASDFIVVKKHGMTKKSFFAGNKIIFTSPLRTYNGVIHSIHNDSLFIFEYDIRQMPTTLGFFIPDTITTYRSAIYYKDILSIYNYKYGFDKRGSGGALLGGGILLTTLGLGSWIFTKPGTQYHASTAFVAGAAALAGIGYLLSKPGSDILKIGKKYQLDYIKVK